MTEDAAALLAWLAARGGTAKQREIGDTAPRRFRKAAVYGPLVDELLVAGAITCTCERPLTFAVARPASAAPRPSGSRLLAMLAEAASDLDDVPAELAAYWAAVQVRDELVGRMRVKAGLPAECPCCAAAAEKVDEAVAAAFGCEMRD